MSSGSRRTGHGRRGAASRAGARRRAVRPPTTADLDALIAEAIVDCYDDSECAMGFYNMFEEHMGVPFESEVLGVPVTVTAITLSARDAIVALCQRGRHRQAIPILDLTLPTPPPAGAEWIAAYRRWVGEA